MPLCTVTANEIDEYHRKVIKNLARHAGLLEWTRSTMYSTVIGTSAHYTLSSDSTCVHVTMCPPAGERLILGSIPFHKILGEGNYEGTQSKTYYMYEHDLYLTTGWMYSPTQGIYMRYRADVDARKQERWDSDACRFYSVRDGTVTPEDMEPVDYKNVPTTVRLDYMCTLAENRARHHGELIGSLVTPRVTSTPIFWRHQWRSTGSYKHTKKYLKQMGQLIANAEDHDDIQDVLDLLEDLHAYITTDRLERIAEIWNERCAPGEEIMYASGCQHFHNGSNNSTYQDGVVCDDCFETYTHCVDVDDYVHEDRTYYYDGEYHYHEQEDDDYEDDEYDNPRSYVMGYSTDVRHYMATDASINPSPYGEFLMGIELEVEPQDDYRDAAQLTRDQMADYAILKRDGSLADHGFEIVTAPRGLTEHTRRFKAWEPHESLRAWDVGACGMHVHISSPAFTQATLGKFIEFINSPHNDDFIKAIAGRHPESCGQCRQYCQREGTLVEGNPKATLSGKNTDRYRMVNTSNLNYSEAHRLGLTNNHVHGRGFNTVELRIFRATLNKDRLLAQIEFAHAAVMFCRFSSFRALTGREFLSWLQPMAGQYPHLSRWFGVRANKKTIDESPEVRETADV